MVSSTPKASVQVFWFRGRVAALEEAAPFHGNCQVYTTTYTGTGEGKFGPLTLQATFTDSAITDIAIGEHEATERVSDRAFDEIPATIIDQQALGILLSLPPQLRSYSVCH